MRGENYRAKSHPQPEYGSSPHARGKRCPDKLFPSGYWAHPRMRGENNFGSVQYSHQGGSSPHARGKQLFESCFQADTGLIPACAGKTHENWRTAVLAGAHPRMRGENVYRGDGRCCELGSSPHARGKPALAAGYASAGGLIPACAGKTLADLDQHRAIEPIRYNLSRTITDIKPRQRREKLEPLSSKGSPPPLRGCPLI